METRHKVAEIYRGRGDEPKYREQLTALVAADAALMQIPAFDKARPENQPDAE